VNLADPTGPGGSRDASLRHFYGRRHGPGSSAGEESYHD
jgi:hypothetical protein